MSLKSLMSVCAGIFLSMTADSSHAADGTWINTAGGTWSTPGNWSGGTIADGAGSTAFFNTLDLTADAAVSLDTVRTNGNLVFSDTDPVGSAAGWTLSGGPLTLSGTAPTITVSNLAAGKSAIISAVLTGQGFIKNGDAMLALTAANTMVGTNQFNGGLVSYGNATALGGNSNTMQFNGGGIYFPTAAPALNLTNMIVSTTATIITTNGNYDNYMASGGQIVGDANSVITIRGANRFTPGGTGGASGSMYSLFLGTIDLADSTAAMVCRVNMGATNSYDLSTVTLNTGTNAGRFQWRTTTAGSVVRIGALTGLSGGLAASEQSGNPLLTWLIGYKNLDTVFRGNIHDVAANRRGALVKVGTSKLSLGGTNTFTGDTTISNGILALIDSGLLLNTPLITVVSPGSLDVSGLTNGTWSVGYTNSISGKTLAGNGTVVGNVTMTNGIIAPGIGGAGTLTFANNLTLGGTETNVFDIISPASSDRIVVTGNLDVSAPSVLKLVPSAANVIITNGTYVLFQYGSLTGDWTNNLVLSYPTQLGTLTLQTNASSQIVLQVANATLINLTWRGDQGSDWTAALNWRDTNGSAATWADGRLANFDGSAVTTTVNLPANVSPARVLITNVSDYTFNTTGGKITGAGVLVKTGSGKVTFAANNDYSGSTTINEGTLQIGNGGITGSAGSGALVNNGAVVFNRSDDVIYGSAISGSGEMRQNGPGLLTLTANNTYTGNTIVSNGVTLQLGNGTLNGTLAGNVIVTNAATLQYLLPNSGIQTVNNGVEGNGTIIYQINPGGNPSTILIGITATNTYFIGNVIVRPGTRLEISTTNGMLGTNITVEYDGGSGIPAAFYAHAGAFTNTQSISIIGQGPGVGVDNPRGFGALRLNNAWAGPITIAGVDLNFLNTTIGGAGGTGTILGNISDGGNNYMLEYFGGTIQVGPTTGVNSYGVTRISEALTGGAPGTSGNTIVVALNTNAFSTNALEMVGQSTLRLNGNNIAFPNVTIPYAGVTNFVPVIQNNSTVSPAILTLGSDGSSWQFDGVFGDGSSQPFSLTKVGAGTLTLSGDSTNTGTVAVNQGVLALIEADAPAPAAPKHGFGTFSNATLITIASGATLDVTARPGGTLTLNSGQTLGGNGTLSGTVNALAGSTVSPGSSVGTLTISSGLTLNGTLLMELNRTNGSQTNDLITVSGTFTSTSGSLLVTNIGPALATGNFFQLFGSGRSFASVTLQTNDVANNKTYTWNNTIASNGRITVQSVATLVNPNPTNITVKANGPNLELTWPADHTGWKLQVQTNSSSVGLKTNWVDVPGSTLVNSVTNTIQKSTNAIFYRMVLP